jgi:hypothetical protein
MQLLTIDTKNNCYVIETNAMQDLQQNVASSLTLESGTFEIKIESGRYSYAQSKTEGEPLVVLWVYGVDGNTFINQNTGAETGATWTTLNGYNKSLQLEVKNKAVVCALFLDVNKSDNSGGVNLVISSNKPSFGTQRLGVDSKKNCYVIDAGIISSLTQQNSNFIELAPGNYKVKIRESNASYWSEEAKFQLEPWALLWIKDGKFISNVTGIEVKETWCSLNGLQEYFILEVKEKTTMLGFFFDTYKEDNKGQVVLEIKPVTQAEVQKEYDDPKSKPEPKPSPTIIVNPPQKPTGGITWNPSVYQNEIKQRLREIENEITISFSETDEKDENKQVYWENLEKSILKNYQTQTKKLAMQVARVEIMMETLTQQMEVNFNENFQVWSNYFNTTINDLFLTRVPRMVSDRVNVTIHEQTQEIKNLVIQQMQTEINQRVESVVNLKINNLTQEIKTSVVQQMQTELEQRIESVVNLKIANQSQDITTQVVNQISTNVDQRIDNAFNIKIVDRGQELTNQIIQQINFDIDQRVDSVVTLKISDQTEQVKNLVIQQMQNYIEERMNNVVSIKIANQSQDISTQVIHQIQSNIDKRIDAVVNLKIANQNQAIKNQVIKQIESDFDMRITSIVDRSTNNNVQVVVNNVVNDLDNRINVNIDNKFLNFRNEVSTLVKNEIDQNFVNSLKNTILGDIKNQQFYIDIQSIKTEIESFYARLGQFESQLYFRIEQGDIQLYNWTLEQLIALQGCLTDRQALVQMFDIFAKNLKDQLNNAECVHPNRFTPWVRRTSQGQFESQQTQQLPQG